MTHDEHLAVLEVDKDGRVVVHHTYPKPPDPPRRFKRFMVFGLDQFEVGTHGLADVVDSFDTIEEARSEVAKGECDDYEILDRETGEEVPTE